MPSDGKNITTVFPKDIMTLTHELLESLPQYLIDTSNVPEEVIVVDGSSAEDVEPDDVDKVEE